MLPQARCVAELSKEVEAHPQFADFDGPANSNDNPVSVAGGDTPSAAATPGQPKLKLTFNAGGAMPGTVNDLQ
jgi:ATP-dependent helicase STH1/SNF2